MGTCLRLEIAYHRGGAFRNVSIALHLYFCIPECKTANAVGTRGQLGASQLVVTKGGREKGPCLCRNSDGAIPTCRRKSFEK